jgi:hypothetical protein
MKNIKIILTASLFITLFSCVNSDNYGTPDLSGECGELTVTKTVQQVAGLATNSLQSYNTASSDAADVIEAYVTSSDEGGNFYKSISFVSIDGIKGFSIPVDDYNLYTKFAPGTKVYVNMKDRFFYNNTQTASLEIGSFYDNATPTVTTDDKVGRISIVEYQNVIKRSCAKVDENTLVNTLTIAAAKNVANTNKLIEIDAVQFSDEFLGKNYYNAANQIGGATNNIIKDINGNSLIVRVSEFANFSTKPVALKSGKIRGVLTKYNSDYQLMVRTESDINFTETRFDGAPPIVGNALVFGATLNEPFTSYTTTNQQIFPKYVNDAVVGSRYWQVKTFGGNKYIQMSSFGGTPEANKTLFFVPVDFTGASTVSFKTKAGFANGACLKVYYSTNYVAGSDVTTATLTNITSSFTIDPGLSSGYPTNFTSSGNWSIPGTLTGNGFLVFEYVGNGNGGVTTTMQIDDIVIN